MTKAVDSSCYILELSVRPGASRWAELHAYTDPAHIRAWLASFCRNRLGAPAYHALWYGATLGVWVIQRGEAVKFIDVHPHIRAQLRGGTEAVPISDRKRCLSLLRPGQAGGAGGDPDQDGSDDGDEIDFERYEELTLLLAWEPIAAELPPLEPPLLLPGQRTRTRHPQTTGTGTYLDHHRSVRFGSYDHELGEKVVPRFQLDIPGADEEEDDELDDEYDDEYDEEDVAPQG